IKKAQAQVTFFCCYLGQIVMKPWTDIFPLFPASPINIIVMLQTLINLVIAPDNPALQVPQLIKFPLSPSQPLSEIRGPHPDILVTRIIDSCQVPVLAEQLECAPIPLLTNYVL